MKGHIRKRGEHSWELKFDAGCDPANGKRVIHYHSFKGTKREAQVKLAELISDADKGSYIEPNKVTVNEFVGSRIDQWEASGDVTARTAARYRELAENQIAPHLGTKLLQKMRPLDIEQWHTALRASGIAARTIGHAHRVLGKALRDAERNEIVHRNVARATKAPKVSAREMQIVRDIPALIEKLKGTRLRVPAMVGLFTGMRLGEILALRWSRVDLDAKRIQVVDAVEYTRQQGVRFKQPKSAAGRREITLPVILVECMREHRRGQLELRMQLGAGRLPDDALLFTDIDGNLPTPNSVSAAWHDFAERTGMPEVTFHALRHTHASQLIDAGIDIVTTSKRLGHADPAITLRVYSHLFRQDDSKAAAAIDAALAKP